MTKLGTTATVTRQIITPGQAPLQPFDEFERAQMRKNLDAHLDECRYMRQTGRTTRMVIEILEAVVNDPDQHIVVLAHNGATVKCINSLLHHYIEQYGLDGGSRSRVHVCTVEIPALVGLRYRTFVDNSVTDAQTLKKIVSRPDTKYRKGQHVDIMIKDVWIRKIEFAGGESNSHQYVGQAPNGAEFFFTEGDVINVVREDD